MPKVYCSVEHRRAHFCLWQANFCGPPWPFSCKDYSGKMYSTGSIEITWQMSIPWKCEFLQAVPFVRVLWMSQKQKYKLSSKHARIPEKLLKSRAGGAFIGMMRINGTRDISVTFSKKEILHPWHHLRLLSRDLRPATYDTRHLVKLGKLEYIPLISRVRGPYGKLWTWNWPITARKISQPYNNIG